MRGKDGGVLSAVQCEQQVPTVRARTSAGIYQCLVVSADPRRRRTLSFTASDEGWEPVVSADLPSARAAAQRSRFGLALIDLEGPSRGTPRGFRRLAEQLAELTRVLIVVCGHADDPREEVWARGIGVWLYLPGLGRDWEVAGVCREAMQVTRRLSRTASLEKRD